MWEDLPFFFWLGSESVLCGLRWKVERLEQREGQWIEGRGGGGISTGNCRICGWWESVGG